MHSSENPARTLEALSDFARRDQLEPVETYRAALADALEVLSESGRLLYLADLPTVIIPDLHARRELLLAVLNVPLLEGSLAGRQIFELLQRGDINVICVGDIMHSEDRSHWVINPDGAWTAELLDKEMVRSLGMGAMVMYLKRQFPNHFHCLRGNHDDMSAQLGPYRKFVGVKRDEQGELILSGGHPVITGIKGESGIVKEWVLNREGWGQTFLEAWTQFERALPLFAQGAYYVITHTLPNIPLSEAILSDPARAQEVARALTWSREVNPTVLAETLDNLGIKGTVQRWFYGHTPVSQETNGGKYLEALDGLAVRLNNSERHVFAYVPAAGAERRFDPTRDVFIKSPEEDTFHL